MRALTVIGIVLGWGLSTTLVAHWIFAAAQPEKLVNFYVGDELWWEAGLVALAWGIVTIVHYRLLKGMK